MPKADQTISILICVRNGEKYIGNCLRSILDQAFQEFEIIIIDDYSNDRTKEVIENFRDKRIKYFRNEKWLGITKSRNRSIKFAKGAYLFFTDSDCVVSRDWIEQGLKYFQDSDCAGVEGLSIYVSADYTPTLSDHTYPMGQGKFMTGNIAYKRSSVKNVGGFDEKYTYFEDRDLALRILKSEKIEFNPNMNVWIRKEIVTPKGYLKESSILKNRVHLFKRFNDREMITGRIVAPTILIKILCPGSIIASLFINNLKTSDDYRLLPFTYVKAVLERIQLWKECAKERVFLI